MQGDYHCPYCGKPIQNHPTESKSGVFRCTCGNDHFWRRIHQGPIDGKFIFMGRYEITMRTDVKNV